jgi:hypothetical protein
MCDANPITTPILLAIALFAYAHRHRNDPPFAQQWYRGCGWDQSSLRGPVRNVSGETNG